MSEFKREERYIVVKLKDINDVETKALRDFLESWELPTVACVVVEPHWPIYESVWAMVKKAWEKKNKVDHVYGFCPKCGAPGISRERRLNGNTSCENGHTYPSVDSRLSLS